MRFWSEKSMAETTLAKSTQTSSSSLDLHPGCQAADTLNIAKTLCKGGLEGWGCGEAPVDSTPTLHVHNTEVHPDSPVCQCSIQMKKQNGMMHAAQSCRMLDTGSEPQQAVEL